VSKRTHVKISMLKQFNFSRGKMLVINADESVTAANFKNLK